MGQKGPEPIEGRGKAICNLAKFGGGGSDTKLGCKGLDAAAARKAKHVQIAFATSSRGGQRHGSIAFPAAYGGITSQRHRQKPQQ